jgi:hypothetical protein
VDTEEGVSLQVADHPLTERLVQLAIALPALDGSLVDFAHSFEFYRAICAAVVLADLDRLGIELSSRQRRKTHSSEYPPPHVLMTHGDGGPFLSGANWRDKAAARVRD